MMRIQALCRMVTLLGTLTLSVSAWAQAPAAQAPAPVTAPAPVQGDVTVPPAAPSVSPSQGAATPTPPATAALPHDLSPWGMFMAADIVVKVVMVGLAFASVVTWRFRARS